MVAVWLVLACGAILFGVGLPLPARIGIGLSCAALGWRSIRSTLLLRATTSIRCLQWTEHGAWEVACGADQGVNPATLDSRSFRLGAWLMVLWLRTAAGSRAVIIDLPKQDARAIRSLCRQIQWPVRSTPDEPDPAS